VQLQHWEAVENVSSVSTVTQPSGYTPC